MAESAQKSATKIACKSCKTTIDKSVWSKRQKRWIECIYCHPCWKKNRLNKTGKDDCPSDETSALVIGVITEATAETEVGSSSICSHGICMEGKRLSLTIISFTLKTAGRSLNPCRILPCDFNSQPMTATTVTRVRSVHE